jgi:hypothetical protein
MADPAIAPAANPAPPPAPSALPDPGLVIGSSPTISEPQKKWAEERARIVSGDVWQQSPEKVALVKDANGKVSAVPRNGADGAPNEPAPGDQPKPGDPQLAPRDSSNRIQLTKGIAVTEQELHDLLAHKAAADSAKLTTPKPGEYKLEFNDDFVLPQGVGWKWNEADPLLAQVREFASANNMSQATFSRLLQMHAASRLGEDLAFSEAKAKELAALGDSGDQRIRAVVTWMRSMVPAEHAAGLVRVLEMCPTASALRAMESLIQRWTNQGAARFNGGNREPIIPGKISDAEYGKLSYLERIAYAARFPQPGG